MVDIRESNQSVIIPNMESIAKYGRKFKQNKKYKFKHQRIMICWYVKQCRNVWCWSVDLR